ncbi:hypothetical protein ACJD0Z_16585 [Flavobacteriaceae bacterium M23B6Z8]
MKKITVFLSCFLTIMVSCSDDGVFNTLSEEPLSGIVFGENFAISGGRATVFGDEYIELMLASEVLDCETEVQNSSLSVSIAVPNRVGVHRNVLVVFNKFEEEPITEVDALVEITEVNDFIVSGKIRSSDTDSNRVEGSFEVSICSR